MNENKNIVSSNEELETSNIDLKEEVKEDSKFSKYFWNTIIILLIIYIILALIAYFRNSSPTTTTKKPLTANILIESTDKLIKNLEDTKPEIKDKIILSKNEISKNIDKNIDSAFDEVINKNVDIFLDFHYSVIGGYVELGTMAFADYDKLINEKLFGNNFSVNFDKAKNNIDNFYIKKTEENLKYIKEKATNGIDLQTNYDELNKVDKIFDNELAIQKSQLLIDGVGSVMALNVARVISTKLAARIAIKTGAKTGIKGSTKLASAGTGAAAGTVCGPLAIVCSPVAAIAGWIMSDAIINSADEFLNRDDFKEEIIALINEEKNSLKNSMNNTYVNNLNTITDNYKEALKNTEIKKMKYIDNLMKF